MMAWFLYATLVSLLLALGAAAAEAALLAMRRPARWVWIAALAGSLIVPLVARVRPPAAPAAASDSRVMLPSLPVIEVRAPMLSSASGDAGATQTANLSLLLWVGSSALALVFISVLTLRLMRRCREWSEAELEGERVLLSRDVGPAVAGIIRSRIVVPAWVLELGPTLRRLLIAHEREHVRAHDVRVLAVALLLPIAAPWNLALWWQWRRLRQAVELDCDARVLRGSGDVRGYAELLLEVGARSRRVPLPVLGFGARRSVLERRIRRMTEGARRRGWRAIVATALAVVMIGGACQLRAPRSASTQTPDAQPTEYFSEGGYYTRAPVLLNPEEAQRLLERSYPPRLAEAGIEGDVVVNAMVDLDGTVRFAIVTSSSGREELDRAAQHVAQRLRFRPAEADGRPVRLTVWIPFEFGPRPRLAQTRWPDPGLTGEQWEEQLRERSADAGVALLARGDTAGTISGTVVDASTGASIQGAEVSFSGPDDGTIRVGPPPYNRFLIVGPPGSYALMFSAPGYVSHRLTVPLGTRSLPPLAVRLRALPDSVPDAPAPPVSSLRPVFTPYTQKPELANPSDVTRLLTQHYPPILRHAGIGGTVVTWVFIDSEGAVRNARVARTSGHAELDSAAVKVARGTRFTPARNRNAPVDVWVQIPIVFSADGAEIPAAEPRPSGSTRPLSPVAVRAYQIGGVVRDAATGQPIAGAQVVLPTAGRGAVTDSAGRFVISSLMPGTHELRVGAEGYRSATQRLELSVNGERILVNLLLERRLPD